VTDFKSYIHEKSKPKTKKKFQVSMPLVTFVLGLGQGHPETIIKVENMSVSIDTNPGVDLVTKSKMLIFFSSCLLLVQKDEKLEELAGVSSRSEDVRTRCSLELIARKAVENVTLPRDFLANVFPSNRKWEGFEDLSPDSFPNADTSRSSDSTSIKSVLSMSPMLLKAILPEIICRISLQDLGLLTTMVTSVQSLYVQPILKSLDLSNQPPRRLSAFGPALVSTEEKEFSCESSAVDESLQWTFLVAVEKLSMFVSLDPISTASRACGCVLSRFQAALFSSSSYQKNFVSSFCTLGSISGFLLTGPIPSSTNLRASLKTPDSQFPIFNSFSSDSVLRLSLLSSSRAQDDSSSTISENNLSIAVQ